MIKGILFFLLLIISFVSKGQIRCATEERNSHLQQIGAPAHNHSSFDQWLREKLQEKKDSFSAMRHTDTHETVYVVPIVVHVIHNGEPVGIGSNIPDQQIFSQIEVINEDFRRQNPDAINTPDIFKPVASDVKIEFVLAKRNPMGLATTGIVRVFSEKTTWHHSIDEWQLKTLSYWPAEDYINVWVVNQLSGNFIAYSTYPVTNLPGITEPNHNRLLDGVVIGRRYFGSFDKGSFELDPIYNKGRSLTHEFGHYFGLRHIWGDGNCDVDDFCDDTPVASSSYNHCPTGSAESCGSIDMFQNYMDYTPDRCMNLFTECQKTRMRIVIENSPRRVSLINSPGKSPPEEFDLDLAVTQIVNPGIVVCERLFIPEIEVINLGKVTVNQFSLAYEFVSNNHANHLIRDTVHFDNMGLPFENAVSVSLNPVSLQLNQYNFSVTIISVNNGIDLNLANNQKHSQLLVSNDRDFIPLVERFPSIVEWNKIAWSVLNPDQDISWEIRRARNGGLNNNAAHINSYNYENIGQTNWLISPALDFSGANSASLWFRYSYAFRGNRRDVLSIAVSTDCGRSFPHLVFESGGQKLSNISSNREWFPQSRDDWSDQKVDLTQFAGERDVRVAFIWTNGNGNNIFIDDIEFYAEDTQELLVDQINDFIIFPNPTTHHQLNIAVRFQERQNIEVTLVDSMGRRIKTLYYQNAVNQILELPLEPLSTGVYVLWVKGPGINKAKRVVIM